MRLVLMSMLLGLLMVACGESPGVDGGTGGGGGADDAGTGGGAATDDAGTGGGAADPAVTCAQTPATVTLAADIQPILTDKCGSCHSAGGNYAFYGDFGSAAQTATYVGKTSIMSGSLKVIAADDLSKSTFWLKILGGTPAGYPSTPNILGLMPPSGEPQLSEDEKEKIKDWICTGAQ